MDRAEKTQIFGQRMMAARLRRALTQQELASRAHVSIRSIQVWEHGGSNLPRPSLMRRLCAELGVLPEELLGQDLTPIQAASNQERIPEWLAPLVPRLERLEPRQRQALVGSFMAIADLVPPADARSGK